MKVAFVVQRYGMEVNGGSEFLCRALAEKMSRHWDLEVLTTCAVDYTTWNDFYPPGVTQVQGVSVRRFNVDFPRAPGLFNRVTDFVYSGQSTSTLQSRWIQEQGPYSSDFLRYLDDSGNTYDLFVFFTYLYGLTVLGLPRVADRSILVPTAHDEPSFHLPLFQALFTMPRGLLFQTPEEQALVLNKFNLSTPHEVVSAGIDDPGEIQSDEFLQTYRESIKGPYLLYMGRIDESKGCDELFRIFISYRARHPHVSLQLVLCGKSVMPIPNHPDICHLGFVEDRFKYAAMANAQVLVMPSAYESLSLVTLESWIVGTPVLVNRKSIVLEGQCKRSGGGLSYENEEEFENQLSLLLKNSELRTKLGRSGREFVKAHYLWDQVESAYLNWGQRVGRV